MMTGLMTRGLSQVWNPNYSIGTVTGKYNFSYTQTPDQLVEVFPPAISVGSGISYQWEQSPSPVAIGTNFQPIGGATATSYTLPGPLTQTMYYRRKTASVANPANYVYSNIIKIKVVSVNWEDINYIREHDVQTTNVTTWTAVDQLVTGGKIQTTTYLDGLGRTVEKVSREIATPATAGGTWGDLVWFYPYDAMGREPLKYLPYTTSSQPGKYKTAPLTEQPQYYTNVYSESSAYTSIAFDNSPLNRIRNVKEAGTAWAASHGDSVYYDVNSAADNVQYFKVDYVQGHAPVSQGAYTAGLLYKLTYQDVNNKLVVEYTDKAGRMILKKIQADATPSAAHSGWICTYSIYDDFGQIRCQVQPEGVKYLDANGWTFAGTNGQTVLNEQCFQYMYDDKGHTTWKKAPGAVAQNMVFDVRDRLVFMQDGNQAALATPQWSATLYDELDRPTITTLYNTTATIASLQTDVNSGTPISTANLANTAVTTILKYLYYDDYSFATVKTFNTGFTNTSAYSTSDPNVQAISPTNRTVGLPTGNLVRVLGTTQFLATTNYYDEKERRIQTLEDNLKAGTDITTFQYYFDGRVLSSCNSHTATGTGYTNYISLTKYNFDQLGRVISLQKQYGSNPLKTVSSFDYDDMGRLKTKHLDPGYTAGGNAELESLNYSYNIHNQITGVNKDYALKSPASYNKWGHFFGFYLGYDNRDNVFGTTQLNGQVGGQLWNTQGDDAQRKYEYSYDNAGRLINAIFTEQQHPGDGWSSTKMDFSVTGVSGQITYDYNGNLLTMLQKGVLPGTPSPLTVDDLRYAYSPYSNKLQSVTDQMTQTSSNGQFGDFKDGANAAGTPDYVYDANGNLVIDLNKNVQSLNNGAAGTNGISYNFLDKPDQIRIVGKGTIKIVYSATGEKLQRVFIPESGGLSTITTYINEYIYQEKASLTLTSPAPFSGTGLALSYIDFEEGRIRVVAPTSLNNGYESLNENGNISLPNSMSGAWDYFITDYQRNVRMILTEETHAAVNTCSMENTGGRPAAEDPVFGQAGAGNEVETTRYTTPAGWTNNTVGVSVSRLGNLAGHTIGPNTLQKVMAGDMVTASVQYYFQGAVTNNNPNIIPNILNSLAGALGGGATGTVIHNNTTAITNQLNATPGFISAVEPSTSTGSTPQAYLTILFFDERMNFISAADGGVAQQQVAGTWTTGTAPLGLSNIKAPKNGYAYIYVSNRSDQDVYFDNLAVGVTGGNIIEENHYYSYGLRISAISSRKLGDAGEGALKNNYLYNDKELFDDADLNWYDYGYRNYDPQIGRFVQLDPLTDEYPFYSPYQYAGNDPVANVDVDGLEPAGVTSFASTLGAGANASIHFIQSGMNAGNWAVSWVRDGVAYAKIFKTVTTTVNTTTKVMSVAIKTVDIVTNFVPIVSGGKDIYQGIKSGNWWQVALGVGSIILDVATLGGSSLVKGVVKTAVKEGAELIIKEEAEQVVKKLVTREVAIREVAKKEIVTHETEQLLLEAPKILHKHHIFPQQFRGWFKAKGIMIDEWCVQVGKDLHLKILHAGAKGGVWNERWIKFMAENPKASASQIFKFGEDLLHEFGLEHLKYIKYK